MQLASDSLLLQKHCMQTVDVITILILVSVIIPCHASGSDQLGYPPIWIGVACAAVLALQHLVELKFHPFAIMLRLMGDGHCVWFAVGPSNHVSSAPQPLVPHALLPVMNNVGEALVQWIIHAVVVTSWRERHLQCDQQWNHKSAQCALSPALSFLRQSTE